jgi:hypothetical protein
MKQNTTIEQTHFGKMFFEQMTECHFKGLEFNASCISCSTIKEQKSHFFQNASQTFISIANS